MSSRTASPAFAFPRASSYGSRVVARIRKGQFRHQGKLPPTLLLLPRGGLLTADFYDCHPKKDLYIPLGDFHREVFNAEADCCDAGRVACVALDGHQAGY